jgi:glycerol-3-phosphate dehydrogenase (NAD(P)+)
MNITILGAGAWGTALAISLADRHKVVLHGRDATAMRDTSVRRENVDYLPGFTLPDELTVTSDFDAALAHVAGSGRSGGGLLILASPVAGLRPLLQRLQSRPLPNVVWLCKGFEEESGLLPHQLVIDMLGSTIASGVLSGPSFAQEVAQGLPCALTVASTDPALRAHVVQALHGRNIRVYSTDDIVGVEVGAAVKNILAIATGVTDGMGLGLNARAALITRGLAEIARLGTALGGRPETFMGLTGLGDLILTCTGDLSRNRKVGLALAQGKSLESIETELGHVAEGVRCAKAVRSMAIERNVDMPIATAVAAILFDGESPRNMITQLLSRDPRHETA